MNYARPELRGVHAISIISEMGNPIKVSDFLEPPPYDLFPSDPAYQADE